MGPKVCSNDHGYMTKMLSHSYKVQLFEKHRFTPKSQWYCALILYSSDDWLTLVYFKS